MWMRLPRRLRNWIHRSILNRLTAISMGTSVLLLLVVSLIAFPLFYNQERSNNASHYRNKLDRASDTLRFRFSTLLDSLDQLAGNSFVVNAFVDSTGREIYLTPTLRDYRAPFGIAQTLTLLDSNLTVFGQSGPDASLTPIEKRHARAALERGKKQLSFDTLQGRPRLLIAVPVYYPPASAHEGVLLASVDPRELLRPAVESVKPSECLTVSRGAQVLLSSSCDANQAATRLSIQTSMADNAEGDRALTVTFGDTEASPFRLLTLIAGVYVALSALALLIVFVATRYVGRRFAGKLEELAYTANALAADPNSTARVRWDASDEVGRLTLAFDTLVEKWREIQSSLEQRVEQRTVELAGALERARDSSRAKSDFLAVMSHEIRTPMNGVVGMVQALEATELSAAQRRQLQVVRGSADLLLRIIDDMLDFSKIEAGKLSLDLAPLQVDRVVQDLIAALLPSAKGRGIELRLAPMAPALSEWVAGDATRVRQVLTNLVHNAVKFTAPGGNVHVAVAVQPSGAARQYVIEVSDTGIGIDASKMQRIFEPFEQADRSTTRRYGGTGLGLAIVRRLVDLMGGVLEVTSEVGRGSKFTVRLTLKTTMPPVTAEASALEARLADLSHLRILIAEDNVTNQIVATAQLNTLGIHRITVAASGREAYDAALREPFDLILMDVQMPDMDGIETTGFLRRAGVATPIIAMTANVMPEDRATYLGAGMVDCLAKPMDRVRLRELIERHGLATSMVPTN